MAALPPIAVRISTLPHHVRPAGALAVRVASRAKTPFASLISAKPHEASGMPVAPREKAKKEADFSPCCDDAELDAVVDPMLRAMASVAPPSSPLEPFLVVSPIASASPASSTIDARAAELNALAHATLDAATFWGDGHRGIARLRFGANARGGLAGATVVLEGDGDRVRLVVEGADAETIEALAERLRSAGLAVD